LNISPNLSTKSSVGKISWPCLRATLGSLVVRPRPREIQYLSAHEYTWEALRNRQSGRMKQFPFHISQIQLSIGQFTRDFLPSKSKPMTAFSRSSRKLRSWKDDPS
jgi:hypothetical protein